MKGAITIFTQDSNHDYFRICVQCINEAVAVLFKKSKFWESGGNILGKNPGGVTLGAFVIDFSEEQGLNIEEICYDNSFYADIIHRPKAGFCSNMNSALDIAKENDLDFLFEINDDAFIHREFLRNALDARQSGITIVGGIPQKDGDWNVPLSEFCQPPEPIQELHLIDNFSRLNWEMSACLLDIKDIGDERYDEYYDPTGLIADNDFFLRLALKDLLLVRAGSCRFWHARGVSQSKVGRNPYGYPDITRNRALDRFRDVWGVDIYDIKKPLKVSDVIERGKKQ